jgi:hypothetical protein
VIWHNSFRLSVKYKEVREEAREGQDRETSKQ